MTPASATKIRQIERTIKSATTHIAKHWSIWAWAAVLVAVNFPLLWGEVRSGMVFLPDAVHNGQWWRVATFALVHLSWYHFLLDAGGFLLLFSCLEEKRSAAKFFYILGAGGGTLLLSLAMDPTVSQQGLSGLSGIAHGLMAISAVEMLRTKAQRSWGCVSLAIVVLKSAYELWSGHVVFEFLHMGMCGQPIAASHAGGVIGGLLAYALFNFLLFGQRKGMTNRCLKSARVCTCGIIICVAIFSCASSLHSHSEMQPPRGRKACVILLHGLCRSSLSMEFIERALKQSGYAVLNLDYASTRKSITDIALDDTAKAVSMCRRQGYEQIHFVTHSMGGIVVRRYLQDRQLPEGSRIVMLAPPNQGSELMDWAVASFPRLSRLAGPGASQLRTGNQTLLARLNPVSAQVGIIIGNTSWNPYFSNMLPGGDDGKVTVEGAKLAEMTDFLIAPCNHTTILLNPMIQRQVVNFLEHGRFIPMN
jgi:rhomboid family GlyGly-CTERM serine protease